MVLACEYFSATGSATANGIFIPVSDLPGVEATEFASSEATLTKECKAMFAILNAMNGKFTDKLGISHNKGQAAGAGVDLVRITHTFAQQWIANYESNTFEVIPLPLTGNLVGINDVTFEDIFPNAAKLDASDSTGAAGVLIPTTLLQEYGAPSHASIDLTVDSRDIIASLMYLYAGEGEYRDADSATGLVTISQPLATITAIPSAAISDNNPTTGLDKIKASTGIYTLLTKTVSFTFEVLLDQLTQKFELNIVIS